MTSADYWRQRAEQNARRVFEYSDRKARLVTRWFRRARREMEKKVRDFYRRYGNGEGISPQAAKAALTDRRALSLSLEEARRLAQLYPKDPELQRLLRQSYLARAVSREEHLMMQLELLASEAYGEYANETGKSLNEAFEVAYYKSIFDYQQFTGSGNSSFNRLSVHQIQAAVETAWKGANYSQRIWGGQRRSLARYLNRIITTGMIEGKANGAMAAELQKAMNMSAYQARRLIRTECAQVTARADMLAYQENGTPQFQFLATLDLLTSEICREMDGKVFDVAEREIGVNTPPLHPFCRSTTIPYIPDDEFDAGNTRAARNAAGETYQVPASMTYREWREKYVDGTGQADILNSISLEPLPITKAAIRAVPLVETEQINGALAEALREQARALLRYVADEKPGTEAILYCDMELKEYRKYKGKSGGGQIGFSPPDRPSIVLHNHPSGQIFSVADIQAFINNPDMETFGAIGNDGTIFLLSRFEDYNASGFMKRYRKWMEQNPGMFTNPPQVTPEEYVSNIEELLLNAEAFRFTFVKRGPGSV